jgi:hypothetical protein
VRTALKKLASVASARAAFAFRFISVLLDSFAADREHDVIVFCAGQGYRKFRGLEIMPFDAAA